MRGGGVTTVAVKTVSIKYSECVCVCVCVALGIQHAKRTRHIVICDLSGSTELPTLNGTILGKKLLNIKCVF